LTRMTGSTPNEYIIVPISTDIANCSLASLLREYSWDIPFCMKIIYLIFLVLFKSDSYRIAFHLGKNCWLIVCRRRRHHIFFIGLPDNMCLINGWRFKFRE